MTLLLKCENYNEKFLGEKLISIKLYMILFSNFKNQVPQLQTKTHLKKNALVQQQQIQRSALLPLSSSTIVQTVATQHQPLPTTKAPPIPHPNIPCPPFVINSPHVASVLFFTVLLPL